MAVTAQLEGFKQLQARIEKVQEAFNEQDALDAAGAFLLNAIRQRFLDTEDPDGKLWPESRAAQVRAATGRDGKTGFDSGDLFRSITLARKGDQRVIFTQLDYADDFQQGPPERIFMGFNPADEEGISRIIEQRIRDAIG